MTWRPWIRIVVLIALGLSVALNFFMVGYAVHGIRQGGVARELIGGIASAYPPEVSQEFRSVLRENRLRTLAVLRDLRTARADLTAAANASPFDEAAVRAAMKNVRDATGNLQTTMQDYLLTALKRVREKPAG